MTQRGRPQNRYLKKISHYLCCLLAECTNFALRINAFIMSQATISIRVDETLKKSFDSLCDEFGFSNTAAITVFMRTVVRERRIPFEIKAPTKQQRNEKAWSAFMELREQAREAGIQDLTLDEINGIISEVRNGK